MTPASKPVVLLVDDQYDSVSALIQALGHEGYAVTVADDGQQALDHLERGLVPDLFIVDLHLPRVMGDDLLLLLRDDPELRHKPVIVITGQPLTGMRVFADAIFRKPYELDDVVAAAKVALVASPQSSQHLDRIARRAIARYLETSNRGHACFSCIARGTAVDVRVVQRLLTPEAMLGRHIFLSDLCAVCGKRGVCAGAGQVVPADQEPDG